MWDGFYFNLLIFRYVYENRYLHMKLFDIGEFQKLHNDFFGCVFSLL